MPGEHGCQAHQSEAWHGSPVPAALPQQGSPARGLSDSCPCCLQECCETETIYNEDVFLLLTKQSRFSSPLLLFQWKVVSGHGRAECCAGVCARCRVSTHPDEKHFAQEFIHSSCLFLRHHCNPLFMIFFVFLKDTQHRTCSSQIWQKERACSQIWPTL